MKDIVFTSEAFVYLNRITSSCVSACKQDMEAFKKYVAEMAAVGKDMKLADFISNSPAEVVFLRDIVTFVEKERIEIINGAAILKFFGGSWHISKVLADIKEHADDDPMLKKKSFSNRFLFDHILTVFCVREVKKDKAEICFSDPYRNCLFIRNITISDGGFDSKVKMGDVVLLHFGKIIAINPDDEALGYIFIEQNKNREFKTAVDYVRCNA